MAINTRIKGFEFKPFSKKQLRLLTWWLPGSPYADYDICIADGSVRAGKTVAMIDSFITWSLASFQFQTFILAGRTMGSLKRNVLQPMFQILTAKGIKYKYIRSSEEPHILIGSNIYYLFGASTEISQDKLQGLTAAGALADEAALYPQSFIMQMLARCSVAKSKVWLNCNPEGPYHYIKQEYIDRAKEKKVCRIHFVMEDNPSMGPAEREKYYRQFTGLFYQRYILGRWVLAEGTVYGGIFDDSKHVVDIIPERFDKYYLGVDYGTNNPCVFLIIGVKGNVLYVVDEYYYNSKAEGNHGRQKTDLEYSQDLKKFIAGRYPQNVIIDPSAASLINQLKRDGVNNIRKANNAVLDGIRVMSSLIAAGRFYVYRKNCPNILKEFTNYVWDEKAAEKGEDKPIKTSDHCLDSARYVCFTIFGREFITQKASELPK